MIDLKLVALGGHDAYGFKRMQLQWRNNGKVVDAKPVISGSPFAQSQPFIHPAKDWSGSGNPIPEGVYGIGEVERGDFGAGLGRLWVSLPVLRQFQVNNRSAFGIHDDANRATARGSAGCLVSLSQADLAHIVKWLESDAKPTQLVVDWGLGFLKSAGYRDPGLDTSIPAPPKPTPSTKFKVLLERGHGPFPGGWEPGAVGPGGVKEYDLNGIVCEAARAELVKAGIQCDVTDSGSALHTIGTLARGYDVFVSVHHNAFNGSAQGSEVLIQEGSSEAADSELAGAILKHLVADLGFPNRGVKPQNLGVLRGAESTNVRACVLTEGYFLDSLQSGHKTASTKYGLAVAKGILEWLV